MADKIAIGSSDGQWIDQHFVNCTQFYIFHVDDGGEWSFAEIRANDTSRFTGQHQESQLLQTLNLVADCSKVLVSRIGPGAKAMLLEKGIVPSTDFISLKHAREKLYASGKS